MSCQHLVCANCAGPVIQGHCSTCRTARAELHGQTVPLRFVVFLLAIVIALTLASSIHGI